MHAVFAKVPDQRRTASRCTASGTRALNYRLRVNGDQRRGAPGCGAACGDCVPRRGAAGGFAGVTGGGAASGGGAVTATTGFLQSVSQTS
jgi:hypothetical protein